jgi:hypothetical protein
MREYLSGSRPKIPDYISAHVETFDLLTASKARKLINERLIDDKLKRLHLKNKKMV